MKIIILGSGIVGVTSAWYLHKAGHEVHVIERQAESALETSFANAGQLSYGYTTPWAAPGMMLKAMKWMSRPHSPLLIYPQASVKQISWLLSMMANCNEKSYKRNKALMVRISDYSAKCLKILRQETGITYDERMQGTIQLFRQQKQLDAANKDVEVLKKDGIAFNILDAKGCVAAEPGLAPLKDEIVGGLQTPQDETGDCQIFTTKLAKLLQERGVEFHYNTQIKKLNFEGNKITSVKTDKGIMTADSYLVCMGSFTPIIIADLGLKAPIYPVKGYSITVPITDEAKAPVSTVIDEGYKVAVTRLGDRIRVGGMAEISDYTIRLRNARMKTLKKALELMFRGSYDINYQPELWSGLRPVTPDSVPILGGTKYNNLFINAGHGTLGWTMSMGCGQFIADLMSGKTPEIDKTGLDIGRYN